MLDVSEHQKAKHWREALGLSQPALAKALGYSKSQIYFMERGTDHLGKPHSPAVWRRYKLACLGLRTMRAYGAELEQWAWT